MGWNIKQNEDGTVTLTDEGSAAPEIELGRGTTDADITYLALRNASGTKSYIFPNGAGTGITVQAAKP